MRELLGSNSAGALILADPRRAISGHVPYTLLQHCAVCGESFDDGTRFLNHMMEKHGFRNPDVAKPDRNSRGY